MSLRKNSRPTFYSQYFKHRDKVDREMGAVSPLQPGVSRKGLAGSHRAQVSKQFRRTFVGTKWIQQPRKSPCPVRDSMASARTRPARVLWHHSPAGTVQVCSFLRSLRRAVGSGQWRWHHGHRLPVSVDCKVYTYLEWTWPGLCIGSCHEATKAPT